MQSGSAQHREHTTGRFVMAWPGPLAVVEDGKTETYAVRVACWFPIEGPKHCHLDDGHIEPCDPRSTDEARRLFHARDRPVADAE